jgi:hypothetical protein
VGALLVFIIVAASLYTSGGGPTVPSLSNLTVEQAESLLKADDLVPDVMPFPCLTQLMPAGIVMASNPLEGESISAGGTGGAGHPAAHIPIPSDLGDRDPHPDQSAPFPPPGDRR